MKYSVTEKKKDSITKKKKIFIEWERKIQWARKEERKSFLKKNCIVSQIKNEIFHCMKQMNEQVIF